MPFGGWARPVGSCGVLWGAVLPLSGCAVHGPEPARAVRSAEPAAAEAQAARALQHYAALLREQDAAAIAGQFAPGGSMQNAGQPAITGREAIRRFLDGFSGYRVLAAEMSVVSAQAGPGREPGVERVTQTGRYAQTVRAPDGRRLQASGWFTAQWRHRPAEPWLIERMDTSPTPPPNLPEPR